MKPQFFLPTLTSAVLLTGINAYNVNPASTQFPKEKLIAPMGKLWSQEASKYKIMSNFLLLTRSLFQKSYETAGGMTSIR